MPASLCQYHERASLKRASSDHRDHDARHVASDRNSYPRNFCVQRCQRGKEAWPNLASGTYPRTRQDSAVATAHKRQDYFATGVQRIDLNESVNAGDFVKRLRACTTNSVEEAAYYEVGDVRCHVQVIIHERPRRNPKDS